MVDIKTDINTIRGRIQGMLTEIGDVTIDRDGDFSFAIGSTRVFIRVVELETFSVATVFAPVLREVRATPDLYKHVAEASDAYTLGHLALEPAQDGSVNLAFVHRILADYIDLEELKRSVYAVAFTADRLDDELKTRFGGLRFDDA